MELLVAYMFGMVIAFAIDSWIATKKTKEQTREHIRQRRIYNKHLKEGHIYD